MRIGAVVVHFRFWPEVRQTLDALLGQTRPPDEIVLVDDRSDDGSAERIREAYPSIDVVVAPENRGCPANMNAGLEELMRRGCDALLMVTHEALLEPDAVETLARRLEGEPRVGQVGPLLGFLSHPHVVFSAGGVILRDTWQNPHAGMYAPLETWRGTGPRRVPWVDGACAMVRAAALREVGMVPQRYFHYYDDVELGVRLNQAGWHVECHCDAVARQQPGLLAEYLRVRNRLGFLHATAPRRVLVRELGWYASRIVGDARAGRRDLSVAQARALRAFVLGRWGRPPASYLDARRRDHPTGGMLEKLAPPQPSVDDPSVRRRTRVSISAPTSSAAAER